ncbi:MAG: rhomboid family intramembrane serine protease [Saprospiraceae bacterium]|nr:rhomboid family intramembrane serine protease [Saprospiraceae bacterium]
MHSLTHVVKNLILINVIVFVAVRFALPIHGIEDYFVLHRPGSPSFEPKRFLILYLSSGFIASVLQMISSPVPILGASGAVYGIIAAFATMFPNARMMLLFPPIPMKAKYMALLFIGLGLYSGLSGAQDGIAHFAHVGGAIMGFVMIKYWKLDGLR